MMWQRSLSHDQWTVSPSLYKKCYDIIHMNTTHSLPSARDISGLLTPLAFSLSSKSLEERLST